MSVTDLTDLLAMPSRDAIEAMALTFLANPAFRVTNWNSGGVMRTILEVATEELNDLLNNAIPDQFAEGFVDTSDGDWTAADAHGLYGLDQVRATTAVQTITLACDATHGPYPFTVLSSRIAVATDGRLYTNATTGTLSPSSTLVLDFAGQSPGAAGGLIAALSPPLPGVTVIAAATKVVGGVPQFGGNDEDDSTLIGRCLARFPDQAAIPAIDRVQKWALASGTEITRTRLDADQVNPGGVLVTVAGISGAVSGGAVTAAQAYIDARSAITDYVIAQNATNLAITISGTVFVPAAIEAQAQAAADASWTAYLTTAQIGATVYLARLAQALADAGVTDTTSLSIGGSPDITLTANQVPITSGSVPSTALTWVAV